MKYSTEIIRWCRELFNPGSPKTYKEEREQQKRQKKKDDLHYIQEHEMTWGKEYEG